MSDLTSVCTRTRYRQIEASPRSDESEACEFVPWALSLRRNRLGATYRALASSAVLFAWMTAAEVAHAQADSLQSNSHISMVNFRPLSVGVDPDMLCVQAIRSAELRYRLPSGLLLAISRVETGRPDRRTGALEPWPWAVNAGNVGLYFDNKADAVRWVEQAIAHGVTSIDTGCLQVNLHYHPNAFATIDEAFDPNSNADYAARFLLQLHSVTGDWDKASGFYHSQVLGLAASYQQRVKAFVAMSPHTRASTILTQLREAWGATTATDLTALHSLPSAGANGMNHEWDIVMNVGLRPRRSQLHLAR